MKLEFEIVYIGKYFGEKESLKNDRYNFTATAPPDARGWSDVYQLRPKNFNPTAFFDWDRTQTRFQQVENAAERSWEEFKHNNLQK